MRIQKTQLLIMVLFISYIQTGVASCIGVGCNCTISATPVNFGTYDPLSVSSLDSSGSVEVTCSVLVIGLNVSYEISLDQGNSGVFTTREMSNGSDQLEYNLYIDAARTSIWGDGTSGTSIVSDSYILNLFSEVRNYTVYGQVPGAQNISVGTYNDSIIATVEF